MRQTKSTYIDSEIIARLQAGGKSFEDTSMYLFEQYRGYIVTMMQKHQISKPHAEDAYADALVKLIRHIKQGTFRSESKISTYFYTIYSNTCVDVLRKLSSNKNKQTMELTEYSAKERDLLNLIEVRDTTSYIKGVIETLGDACKGILMDWAYYGYNMEEIAKRSSLANAESARSMKYKCLKKLKAKLSKMNIDHG